jgi:FMN phosphatase YigB (HAD superfamily)
MRSIFEVSFSELFLKFNLGFNPVKVAQLLVNCHINAQLYPDALPFMKTTGALHPICLSCDADSDMLLGIRSLHGFQRVFTSEDLKTYKLYGDGSFFRMVASRSGFGPAEIIHIGDSPSEIAGAKKAGLATCWLNRTGTVWLYTGDPDYEVHTLSSAARILGVEA